jgi:hypothetical protein
VMEIQKQATGGMPQPATGMHLDADAEFAKMQVCVKRRFFVLPSLTSASLYQLDFIDSNSTLSMEEFQLEWERARYGEVCGV